ncbi:rhomboid family intramembrane serine protease [Thalassotalea sp. ND16A]|uniref:rhomboid family intramembrane serine protease n=1 Tax=Thalassotalea sp. ND16A TaxID=1535422 RepID=UPI00051A849C|nr:rhomboid family intramembrane serine protease [Thalassotalea sp. ND16A]KGJ95700.1 hypothetical protein ND16A_1235 [Thalassotalea sp. ND16A]
MTEQTPSLQNSIAISTIFVLVLWWLKLCEMMFGLNFQQLGVYPLTASGIIGIVTGPLIHGSWQHVISNTLPILLLGSFLLYGYPKSRWWTLAIIWIVSGLGVWLFGRESYHLGASGLAHGMFFYLFISGILRRDKRSSALMMVAFYMYGGMLLSILPREQWISFEYHLFGALSGAFCALVFRHWDPKPKRKVYSWEGQEDEDAELNHDQGNEEKSMVAEQWKSRYDD